LAAPHALDGSAGFAAPQALDGSSGLAAPQAEPQAAAGFSVDFPAPQAVPHAAPAFASSAFFVHPNKFANITAILSAGIHPALASFNAVLVFVYKSIIPSIRWKVK